MHRAPGCAPSYTWSLPLLPSPSISRTSAVPGPKLRWEGAGEGGRQCIELQAAHLPRDFSRGGRGIGTTRIEPAEGREVHEGRPGGGRPCLFQTHLCIFRKHHQLAHGTTGSRQAPTASAHITTNSSSHRKLARAQGTSITSIIS
jgi:hypothetical protein